MSGSAVMATTEMTEACTDTDTIITVVSTTGFPDTGHIRILDEEIWYASKSTTTFKSNPASPMVRGSGSTVATAHAVGEEVRTIESGMMNDSLQYQIAVITDTSGVMGFVTLPFRLIALIITFAVLPLSFLGGELEIITYIWGVIVIGIIASLGISLAGGRKMA